MIRFGPQRYLAVETVISVVINLIVTTAPSLLFTAALDPQAERTVRDVAVSLTPQLLMCAFMSALVPSLLTRWRQRRGRLVPAPGTRPSLIKAVVVASALAASFTVVMLASIHLLLPRLVDNRMGSEAVLLLSGAQGALAPAVITPLALVILFGVSWTWTSPPFS